MQHRPSIVIGIQIVIATVLAVATIMAVSAYAEEEGDGPVPAATQLGTAFTYQGRLTGTSGALTGTFDFRFGLWDAPELGVAVSGFVLRDDIEVTNGLFTVTLDFPQEHFSGDERYLEVEVREGAAVGAYEALTPRQQLTATPYALSLRPGATISGDSATAALTLANANAGNDSAALIATSVHGDGLRINQVGNTGIVISDPALFGAHITGGALGLVITGTTGQGINITNVGGYGIFSATNNSTFAGGHFANSAAGGAGLEARGGDGLSPDIVLKRSFDGGGFSDDGRLSTDPDEPGADMYLLSNDAIIAQLDGNNDESGNFQVINGAGVVVFDVDESGNLEQQSQGLGLAKAVAVIICGDSGSSVFRAETSTGTVTVTNGASDGSCRVNFGFNTGNRYIVATVLSGNVPRMVTYVYTPGGDEVDFYRWDEAGVGVNGSIVVAVF